MLKKLVTGLAVATMLMAGADCMAVTFEYYIGPEVDKPELRVVVKNHEDFLTNLDHIRTVVNLYCNNFPGGYVRIMDEHDSYYEYLRCILPE
jgi:hypothetical protein